MKKRMYKKPQLNRIGDVKTLTLANASRPGVDSMGVKNGNGE